MDEETFKKAEELRKTMIRAESNLMELNRLNTNHLSDYCVWSVKDRNGCSYGIPPSAREPIIAMLKGHAGSLALSAKREFEKL